MHYSVATDATADQARGCRVAGVAEAAAVLDDLPRNGHGAHRVRHKYDQRRIAIEFWPAGTYAPRARLEREIYCLGGTADERCADLPICRSPPSEPTQRAAWRKLAMLDAAEILADLRVPPGNRLEKLSGDRGGQYSIRINRQWRICFRWSDSGPEDVEIVDYH